MRDSEEGGKAGLIREKRKCIEIFLKSDPGVS